MGWFYDEGQGPRPSADGTTERRLALLELALRRDATLASAFTQGGLRVETAALADLSVTTAKLANLAVSSAKLASGAVTTSKLGLINVGGTTVSGGQTVLQLRDVAGGTWYGVFSNTTP